MASILITGGTGFIGSHTCVSLLQHNYDITILDSCINSSPLVIQRIENILKDQTKIEIKKKLRFFKGDIRDTKLLEEIFEESIRKNRPIEAVIHFAGLKSVSDSFEKPALYWQINVIGSKKLLNVMDKFDCRTIVFSSSAMVYDSSSNFPLNEDSLLKPVSPYAKTKLSFENILHKEFSSGSKNWRIANLRYFNPAGAHISGLIGESCFTNKPNNLLPNILQVAYGKKRILNIYGRDWPTYDGTCIRDYIHVMDLAEAHFLTLRYLFKFKKKYINLNISTGTGTSILEFIKTFERVNQCSIAYKFKNKRKGDVSILFSKNDLARSTLNWEPKYTLEEICLDSWRWIRKNPTGY